MLQIRVLLTLILFIWREDSSTRKVYAVNGHSSGAWQCRGEGQDAAGIGNYGRTKRSGVS